MKEYRIRQASIADLDRIAELEKLCFPKEEAASRETFGDRLMVYANHFWLLEADEKIISMVNGMVTNEPDLRDEMYYDASMHNEYGSWQMIFGVETHPDYQKKGYAAILMNRVIEDAESNKRAGLVLTCKEKLIPYYEKFGFENEGLSDSEHGRTVWYQMRKKL
ncbi:MAG: GNAT family N-acetyltransferase [Ruminococcus sp.]|nr:GNAT family N-acetyltransferase [Ruminococcus sp.]